MIQQVPKEIFCEMDKEFRQAEINLYLLIDDYASVSIDKCSDNLDILSLFQCNLISLFKYFVLINYVELIVYNVKLSSTQYLYTYKQTNKKMFCFYLIAITANAIWNVKSYLTWPWPGDVCPQTNFPYVPASSPIPNDAWVTRYKKETWRNS